MIILTDDQSLFIAGRSSLQIVDTSYSLYRINFSVMNKILVPLIDYRGYGLSEGSPTEEGIYADVTAAIEWLSENGLKDNRLVMYGFSMGSAAACELTVLPSNITPSALILEAPFASAALMVQDASQIAMPASFVTNLKIDNAEKIKHIAQPFLWMHGDADLFLNYKHTVKWFSTITMVSSRRNISFMVLTMEKCPRSLDLKATRKHCIILFEVVIEALIR